MALGARLLAAALAAALLLPAVGSAAEFILCYHWRA